MAWVGASAGGEPRLPGSVISCVFVCLMFFDFYVLAIVVLLELASKGKKHACVLITCLCLWVEAGGVTANRPLTGTFVPGMAQKCMHDAGSSKAR